MELRQFNGIHVVLQILRGHSSSSSVPKQRRQGSPLPQQPRSWHLRQPVGRQLMGHARWQRPSRLECGPVRGIVPGVWRGSLRARQQRRRLCLQWQWQAGGLVEHRQLPNSEWQPNRATSQRAEQVCRVWLLYRHGERGCTGRMRQQLVRVASLSDGLGRRKWSRYSNPKALKLII